LAILAAEAFPNAQIVATDLSPDALAVAQINVESYGLAERITLAQGDLFAALNDPIEPFDLILANPPYVTTEAMANLPDEFRHEPQLALAAGDDGMTLVRRIVADAPRYLTLGGRLLVEVGHNRREAEAALAVPGKPSLPLTWLATAGHPEAVFALTAPW
jgi:ribosomal protein L3 glutamine methyltransferase